MKKRNLRKVILILAAAAAVIFMVLGLMLWRAGSDAAAAVDAYNSAAEEYNARIAPYNEAASGIAAANEELQKVLDTANGSLEKGAQAYEPETQETLQKKVKEAEKALVDVPVQIEPFERRSVTRSLSRADLDAQKAQAQAAAAGVEEAGEKIPPVPEIPDYSSRIQEVEKAQKAYSDSVQKLKNVTAPPDSFVKERLKGIKTVAGAEAVTEKNDPNKLLGTKGGYVGCVYFLDSRIDRDLLPSDAFAEDQDPGDGTAPEEEEEAGSAASGAVAETEGSAALTSAPAVPGAVETGDVSSTAVSGAMEAAGASGSDADQAGEPAESSEKEGGIDIIRIGTEGGGAVEVFATPEEAAKRDEYLAFFDGSVMDPGSHAVEGTCVIRTSKHLGGDEQEELTDRIRQALLAVE